MEDVYAAKPWLKHYDKNVPEKLDYPSLAYADVLKKAFREVPSRVAVHYMGREITYRELDGLSNRFARFLMETGCRPGDVVGSHLLMQLADGGVGRRFPRLDGPAWQADLPGMIGQMLGSHGEGNVPTIGQGIEQSQDRGRPGLGRDLGYPRTGTIDCRESGPFHRARQTSFQPVRELLGKVEVHGVEARSIGSSRKSAGGSSADSSSGISHAGGAGGRSIR